MYKKILVPLDGSELSESVMEHVVAIAKNCRMPQVVLLRVREPLDEDVRKTLDVKIANELDKAYRDEVDVYLKKIAADLKAKGVTAKTEVLAGNPAEEIIDYAEDSDIDLIIMSTHGRSGVSRWVFGSVADRVIRHTKKPVLIKPAVG